MYICGNSFQYYTYEVMEKFIFYKIKFKSLARFGGNFMSKGGIVIRCWAIDINQQKRFFLLNVQRDK